jgi:type VI secretion system Hcp family effector
MAKRIIVMLVLASGLFAAGPAAAAGVLYLQIPGVTGPVTATGFKGAIEVLSFSMGAQAPGSAARGKLRTGEICSDLAVMKLVDQTSPILFQHTVFGFFYKNVTLTFSQAQGDQLEPVYKLVLNNAAIQSVEESGANEIPTESVSFKASSWTVTYSPTLSTGQPGSPVTTTVTCQ